MSFEQQEPGAAAQRDGLDDATAREAAAHDEQQKINAAKEENALRDTERNQRLAEFNAHPHTQLTGILKSLQQRPSSFDINGRVGALHNAVARLTQMLLGSVGQPPVHPDKQENENVETERQNLTVRTDGQVTAVK